MDASKPLGTYLPQSVLQELKERLAPSERLIYSIQSDLTLELQFGENYVVLTTRRIAVWGGGAIVNEVLYTGIQSVVCQEEYGNARLVALTSGGDVPLAACTLALAPDFHHVSRLANQYIRGEHKSVLAEPPAAAYCPKCGSPIPERDQGCSLCVTKKTIIRRLIGLIAPYPVPLTLLIIGTVLAVLATMAQPYITKMIVDDGIKGERRDLLLSI